MHWIQRKRPQLSAMYRSWINQEKLPKMPLFSKMPFFEVFLALLRNGTLQRAGVFCVVFSASGRFFWAIKINFPTIFQNFYHNKNLKQKQFWNQKGKPHTMTHGRDNLIVFGRKLNSLNPVGVLILELCYLFQYLASLQTQSSTKLYSFDT